MLNTVTHHRSVSGRGIGVVGLLVLVSGFAGIARGAGLEWVESGVADQVTAFRPMVVRLSPARPRDVVKLPDGLLAPRYGSIRIGTETQALTLRLVSDEPLGKPTRLFVAGGGGDDFSDVTPSAWVEQRRPGTGGSEAVSYTAEAVLEIPALDGRRRGRIKFYSLSRGPEGTDPMRTVHFYADYGLRGQAVLGDRNVPAIVIDSSCRGDFRVDAGNATRSPTVWLDLNGDGKPGRNELNPAGRPFEADGHWWAVTDISLAGGIQMRVASPPAPSGQAGGPDLSPGQKAPAFTAAATSGRTIKFPEEFAGKVVLLDFWAMWSTACVAELPELVAAHERFHAQGFEILGVSLDRREAGPRLAEFTQKQHMSWPQIFDGRGWSAAVAQQYGVRKIPRGLLVDGDSGVILASLEARGESLALAIEKALAAKRRPAPDPK